MVGFYRKYDDVIRMQPGYLRQFTSTFTGSPFVDNRTWALEALLPRWPGFCGRDNVCRRHRNLTAEQALRELQNVVTSVKYILVWENNQPENACTPFTPKGFTDQIIAKVGALNVF